MIAALIKGFCLENKLLKSEDDFNSLNMADILDSLKFIELFLQIEKEVAGVVSMDDFYEMNTFGELIECIESRTENAHS